MKQCISRLINWIIHLWRTLKEYVRKITRGHIRIEDVTGDEIEDIVITIESDVDIQQSHIDSHNGFDPL